MILLGQARPNDMWVVLASSSSVSFCALQCTLVTCGVVVNTNETIKVCVLCTAQED